jgi:hypothetical protein
MNNGQITFKPCSMEQMRLLPPRLDEKSKVTVEKVKQKVEEINGKLKENPGVSNTLFLHLPEGLRYNIENFI